MRRVVPKKSGDYYRGHKQKQYTQCDWKYFLSGRMYTILRMYRILRMYMILRIYTLLRMMYTILRIHLDLLPNVFCLRVVSVASLTA